MKLLQKSYIKLILYKLGIKTKPSNPFIYRPAEPQVIFHGGCLGCLSQSEFGINNCKKCKYFKANWDLPDLSFKSQTEKSKKFKQYNRKLKIDSLLDD